MTKQFLKIVLSVFVMASTLLVAKDIETSGVGRAVITEDFGAVKTAAKREAIRKAVMHAVNKALGPNASEQSNIQAKLPEIIEQIDQYKTDSEMKADKEGNEYVVKYNLKFDDQKFRVLLSDMGIDTTVNAVRSNAILVIMDEFFTVPIDMRAPLEEVTTYAKDKSTHYKKGEAQSTYISGSDTAVQMQAKQSEGTLKRSESGVFVDADAGKHMTYANGKNDTKLRQSQNEQSVAYRQQAMAGGSASTRYVDAAANDKEFFQKVVKYQPRSTAPQKQNTTLTALYNVFGAYDIKYLDNDIFKSKYFGNSPISLDKLTNSAELAKYAVAAGEDQKADFFAIGTSIIVDKGKNSTTGQYTCDGTIVMKVYATSSQAENISAGTLTESGAGSTADTCKGNIAKKMAGELGPVIAAQIKEYYKKRQMYGKEYIVQLVGKYSLGQRKKFTKSLMMMDGVKNVKKRSAKKGVVEFVVTYSGEDLESSIVEDDALLEALALQDALLTGNELKLCQTVGCE